MKITKRQLKKIIKEEKQKLIKESAEGETHSLYVLDQGNGTILIQDQYDDSASIEFPATEIRALIDVLYSIHEASRQQNR